MPWDFNYIEYSLFHQNEKLQEVIDDSDFEHELHRYLEIFSEFYARLRSIKRFNLPDENNEYYKRTLYKANEEEKIAMDIFDILKGKKEKDEVEEKHKKRVEYLMSNISKKDSDDGKTFRVNTDDLLTQYYIRLRNDFLEKIEQQKEQNNRLIIINLVSTLELFINQILEFNYLHINKGWEGVGKKTLTYSEILKFNNINNLKQSMVDKIIKDLNYKKFPDVIKEVKNVCFNSNKDHHELFNSRVEVVKDIYLTRNIITHNNGIINANFVEEVFSTDYKVGDEISISEDFLRRSTNSILELGIEIFSRNFYTKKLLRYSTFRDELETKGISIMNDGEFQTSRILFYYMRKFYTNKPIDYEESFMPHFNYWLTFKLSGEIENRYPEIEGYFKKLQKTTTLSPEMILGKTALLDDDETFLVTAIPYLENNSKFRNQIILNTLRWPIFKIIEEKEEFIEFRENLLYNNEEK
ncbi:hypothetical protein [Aerococcus viridans]